MYFTLSPFFYFIANQKDIENYIVLETDGEDPRSLSKDVIKIFAKKFINRNSHGVDENHIDKYVDYICEHI